MSARTAWPTWPSRTRNGRRYRGRRIVLSALLALLVLLTLGAAGLWWTTNHYADRVQRIPNAFPNIPAEQRPDVPEGADGALNILLAGVDSRSERATTGSDSEEPLWRRGAQRADSIMLVHLSADRRASYTVSIPRDSWVPVPGNGPAKINAAFSWGGPPLLIDTVEKLTGIRIDQFAMIDWHGFRSLTDAVGGVPITVPADAYDSQQDRRFKAGTQTMNGEEALSYVRQRYGLPRGDLDRVERQQQFMHGLMSTLRDEISVTDPLKLNRVLDAVTSAVSVDDTMSNGDLRDLAFGLRHLSSERMTFATAPVTGLGEREGQSVVILDEAKSRAMWQGIRADEPSLPGRSAE